MFLRLVNNARFVVAVIVFGLIALLVPAMQSARWAASGHLRLPVAITIYNAIDQQPIDGAMVAVFRDGSGEGNRHVSDPFAKTCFESVPPEHKAITGANGVARINYEFKTGASDRSPAAKAHLSMESVVISAEGFQTVAVTVHQESRPVENLKRDGEIRVRVGLRKKAE